MTTTAGNLQLFDWRVSPIGGGAHAYGAGERIPVRSLCQAVPYTIMLERPTTEPVCPVCATIVRGAAARALDELAVLGSPVPEGELRALAGDR